MKVAEDKQTRPATSGPSREHVDELQKMKEQIALLMDKVEAASAASSPEQIRQLPLVPAQQAGPHGLFPTATVLAYRPSTPSTIAYLRDDLDADAAQWAQTAAKRNTLPPTSPSSPEKRPETFTFLTAREKKSVRQSSLASEGRIFSQRDDTAARLEGHHPDIIRRWDGRDFEDSGQRRREEPDKLGNKGGKDVKSAWSPDTLSGAPLQASRMPSIDAHKGKQPRKVSKPLPIVMTVRI